MNIKWDSFDLSHDFIVKSILAIKENDITNFADFVDFTFENSEHVDEYLISCCFMNSKYMAIIKDYIAANAERVKNRHAQNIMQQLMNNDSVRNAFSSVGIDPDFMRDNDGNKVVQFRPKDSSDE